MSSRLRRRQSASLSYREAVLATQPAGYWRLGEASGTVAHDEVGANPGTYVGSPTLGAAGLLTGDPDTAVTFTAASNQYVAAASSRIIGGLTNSSIAAWFTIASAPGSNTALYAERNFGGNDIIGLYVTPSGARPAFVFRDDAGTIDLLTPIAGTYFGNGRHFSVATKSGSTLTLYADGVSVLTASLTASDTLTQTAPSTIAWDGGVYLTATLDEPAIWNRALTANEIAELYRIGMGH